MGGDGTGTGWTSLFEAPFAVLESRQRLALQMVRTRAAAHRIVEIQALVLWIEVCLVVSAVGTLADDRNFSDGFCRRGLEAEQPSLPPPVACDSDHLAYPTDAKRNQKSVDRVPLWGIRRAVKHHICRGLRGGDEVCIVAQARYPILAVVLRQRQWIELLIGKLETAIGLDVESPLDGNDPLVDALFVTPPSTLNFIRCTI